MQATGPNRPQATPVTLDKAATAVAVLDLTVRCDDPKQVCAAIIPGIGAMLDRARSAGVPVILTGTIQEKGTHEGHAASGLRRRDSEPMWFPDGYDKFVGGELEPYLKERGVKNLVIVGSSTHLCVMYTATAAARSYGYNVVIPLDGVNARNPYEHDYAIHQLTVLPAGTNKQFRFTTLKEIAFQ